MRLCNAREARHLVRLASALAATMTRVKLAVAYHVSLSVQIDERLPKTTLYFWYVKV